MAILELSQKYLKECCLICVNISERKTLDVSELKYCEPCKTRIIGEISSP